MKVKEKKVPKHKDVLNLLLTAEGHLKGIEKMIRNDEYCIDVSKQILAVNAILKKINLQVLKKHLETCVKDAIKEGNAEEKIDELETVIDYLVKGKS